MPAIRTNEALWLRIVCMGLLTGCVATTALAWLLPVEIVQTWALEQAGQDSYRQFEAIGRAEVLCWIVRFAAPMLACAAYVLMRNLSRAVAFVANATAGWKHATQVDQSRFPVDLWRTVIIRVFCIGWCAISIGNCGQSFLDCVTTWTYFRLKSGGDVLPNISDSNRWVIRYLLNSTPPNSKIFVASDQKLYFLSYYLLPRRLYHKVHPDSEFVIPQPHQQRRLDAYRLSEIDSETINRISPDFVLEYFEHPDFVDQARLRDDPNWIAYFRSTHRGSLTDLTYLVRLRAVEKGSVR